MAGSDNIRRIRDYIISMPSLPTTVSKVLEVCNNPRTSPLDLDKVISLDPVLMGKVLKLINSAYYGLSTQVTSLARAIIMLGVNTVKNLALSTAVIDKFGNKGDFRALNPEGFWRHSLCVGVAAKMIAKRRGADPRMHEEYFAAGLLHDIGKIPINNALAEEYIRTMSLADRERIALFLAEKRSIDVDHCEAGKMVAEAWKLDGPINDTITFHHALESYAGGHRDVVLTVAVANYFANREGIGFSGNLYPDRIPPEVFEELGMAKSVLDDIEDNVNAEIEKAKVFLAGARA
ncbi:MAG: HDOD domain-containing protein [Spirochaetes bacterium]|nr:HDOD domain-containing protein [Spirochaetota bacterium]